MYMVEDVLFALCLAFERAIYPFQVLPSGVFDTFW